MLAKNFQQSTQWWEFLLIALIKKYNNLLQNCTNRQIEVIEVPMNDQHTETPVFAAYLKIPDDNVEVSEKNKCYICAKVFRDGWCLRRHQRIHKV